MPNANNPTWPSDNIVAVTPHDSTNFTDVVRQLYVGLGGDVTVVTVNNQVITFKNAMTGSNLGPFFIKRVNATGTTAANLVAYV